MAKTCKTMIYQLSETYHLLTLNQNIESSNESCLKRHGFTYLLNQYDHICDVTSHIESMPSHIESNSIRRVAMYLALA